MIRRLVLVAAAAALVLAPSTAMAYPPPGFATVVTDVTPAAGAVLSSQIVTVHAVGAAPAAAGGKLSRTGFDATGLAVGGGLLVLADAGAVVVAKRRKSSQAAA